MYKFYKLQTILDKNFTFIRMRRGYGYREWLKKKKNIID